MRGRVSLSGLRGGRAQGGLQPAQPTNIHQECRSVIYTKNAAYSTYSHTSRMQVSYVYKKCSLLNLPTHIQNTGQFKPKKEKEVRENVQ